MGGFGHQLVRQQRGEMLQGDGGAQLAEVALPAHGRDLATGARLERPHVAPGRRSLRIERHVLARVHRLLGDELGDVAREHALGQAPVRAHALDEEPFALREQRRQAV